jgi:hypothetical protein
MFHNKLMHVGNERIEELLLSHNIVGMSGQERMLLNSGDIGDVAHTNSERGPDLHCHGDVPFELGGK